MNDCETLTWSVYSGYSPDFMLTLLFKCLISKRKGAYVPRTTYPPYGQKGVKMGHIKERDLKDGTTPQHRNFRWQNKRSITYSFPETSILCCLFTKANPVPSSNKNFWICSTKPCSRSFSRNFFSRNPPRHKKKREKHEKTH